jgi:hypothetical protein
VSDQHGSVYNSYRDLDACSTVEQTQKAAIFRRYIPKPPSYYEARHTRRMASGRASRLAFLLSETSELIYRKAMPEQIAESGCVGLCYEGDGTGVWRY